MAYRELLLGNRNLQDLNPLIAGEESCSPGHCFGPAVRKYTLLHYVMRGKGVFYARGEAHPVQAGQMFVILPEEVTTYQADEKEPWHYRWIGFDGLLSEKFAQLPPVMAVPEMFFDRMLRLDTRSSMAEYQLAGELFSLYAYLFKDSRQGSPHVHRVENYIRSGYMNRIRVEQIARELNLDRRYLSRRFKEETGLSIQEYLIWVRLEEAQRLLLRG